MVVLVGDDDAVQLLVEGHAGRPIELPGPVALRAELSQVLPVPAEDLDAIVRPVGDDDVRLVITADAPWAAEFALLVAFAAYFELELQADRCVAAILLDLYAKGIVLDRRVVHVDVENVHVLALRDVREKVLAVLSVVDLARDRLIAARVDQATLNVVAAGRAQFAEMIACLQIENRQAIA